MQVDLCRGSWTNSYPGSFRRCGPTRIILSFPTTLDFQYSLDGAKTFQNGSISNITTRVGVNRSPMAEPGVILLVEDEPRSRAIYRDILEHEVGLRIYFLGAVHGERQRAKNQLRREHAGVVERRQ